MRCALNSPAVTERNAETGTERHGTAPHVPAGALASAGGMDGWAATVVWALVPERVTWRLVGPAGEVRYLKVAPRGTEVSLADERDRLRWAATRLTVPHVLDYGTDGENEWLLTAGIDATSAVDDTLCADPPRLVPLLADGLRQFHAAAWHDCPFDGRLDRALTLVRRRLWDGLGEPDYVFQRQGGLTARAALEFLERARPEPEDLVVSHGDYCVPNVLIRDWGVAGFVDLGALAVADRWRDLAVALWSVTRNMGAGWEDRFLETYGVARDPHKLAYYHLLYDLLP